MTSHDPPLHQPAFELLFEASPHPYLILLPDAAYTIVAVNDRYLAATGMQRAAILGRGLFEVFPGNPAAAPGSGVSDLRASLCRVQAERRPDVMGVQKYDLPLRDGSGGFEPRYWRPGNTPAFGADGGIAYLIHHVEDVTEFYADACRRDSDARLAAALARLDAHMANAPLAIIEFDPQFRVTRWSKEAERLFGWSAGEVLGRAIAEQRWVYEDDVATVQRISAEMLSGTRPSNMCCNRNYRRDGTVIHCEWYNSALYDADGRLVSILSQVLDVSERSRAAAALSAAKEEAEQASRAKSIFLGNMSHEIRTPLHIIVGLGHLLRRDLADPLQQQRVDQLCANSDHLLALVNDILDLSKIEADRLVLDDDGFRLGSVIDRVRELIDRPARAKGIGVTVDVAPALRDLALRGDGLRLTQILINLGANAVKFTERGSVRLEIAVRAEDAAGVTLDFAVADTGIGINAADQAKLFQVFSQIDGSTSRMHGGSGLGLAISQRLAGLMGGRISVESQPGAGSRFSLALTLPRASAVPEAADHAGTDLAGSRVLFAEDHPLSQEILFEMLEDLGCEVDAASDGAEAVACAQARDYDLILMDMQMPRMDGLAATSAIRALPQHRDTPIIALTANVFAEDRQRCLDAGMNGHLGKPVTPAALAATLGQWLAALSLPAVAPVAQENALTRALAAIPGLDPACALRRSPRQLAAYPELLRRFVADHADNMERVSVHLAAGERDAAHVVAHNLKGISGLIGARRVAACATELVLALRGGANADTLARVVAACDAELKALATALPTLPPA